MPYYIHSKSHSTFQVPKGKTKVVDAAIEKCTRVSWADYIHQVKKNQAFAEAGIYLKYNIDRSLLETEELKRGRFIHRKYLPPYPSNILDIEEIIHEGKKCQQCGNEMRGHGSKKFCNYECYQAKERARYARRKLEALAERTANQVQLGEVSGGE